MKSKAPLQDISDRVRFCTRNAEIALFASIPKISVLSMCFFPLAFPGEHALDRNQDGVNLT